MNDTIAKMAEERSLNKNHVGRVCEMANMATHQAMWPGAKEKEKIAFTVANPKVIVIRMGGGHDGGGEVHHRPMPSIQSDYMSPPGAHPDGPSLAQMFGVNPNQPDAGAARKRIIIIMQKKAGKRDDIRSRLIVETMRYESEKKAAYKAVKQEVLGGTSIEDIADAAAAAGLGKLAAEVMPEFLDALVGETDGHLRLKLEKVAIAPAGDEYISNNLGNITIVNGAHPVLVALDLLHRRDGSIRALHTGLTRVNDELKVYGQRIREMQ